MQNSGADVTQSGGPVIGGQQDGVGPTEKTTTVANQLLASSTAAPTASGTSAPAPEVKGQQAMNEPKDIPESSAQGAKKKKRQDVLLQMSYQRSCSKCLYCCDLL